MYLAALGEHRPERGVGRLNAEAEIAEPCLEQDRDRDVQGRERGRRRQQVRQDVPPEHRQRRDADRARGADEVLLAQRQRLGARRPGVGHPLRERDHEDQVPDPAPDHGEHAQGEQHDRDREHGVGAAHQDVVDPAPEVAGDHAHGDPDHARDRHGRGADLERDADRDADPCEHVAAERVRAEQMAVGSRRLEPLDEVLVVGRPVEEEAGDREPEKQQDQRQPDACGRRADREGAKHCPHAPPGPRARRRDEAAVGLGRPDAHRAAAWASRMRGSSAKYARSTRRLRTTISVPVTSVTASTTA